MTTNLCHCGRPSPTSFLCQPCTDTLERALGDLPSWMSELEITVTRQAKLASGGGKRSKTDGPLPFDWNASDLAWAAQNTVQTWAKHIAEARGVDLSRIAIYDPSAFLLGAIQSIRQDEAAAELFDEITSLLTQIQRAVDRTEERWYAGPCHAATVVVTLAGETVITQPGQCQSQIHVAGLNGPIKCDGWGLNNEPGCGAVHDPEDRKRWLEEHVEEHLLTLDELLPALPKLTDHEPPPPATLRQWKKRGRLVARSINRYGVELYLGADVLTLVRDEERRPGPRRKLVDRSA